MSRAAPVSQLNVTVGQLVRKAKRSSKPVEIREAEMVIVVMPQRDYEQFQAIRRAKKIRVTRPRKTRAAYLAETLRTLREYEKKYKMTSAEFYRRFQAGELGEDELDYFDWRVEYNAFLNLTKQPRNV